MQLRDRGHPFALPLVQLILTKIAVASRCMNDFIARSLFDFV